MFDLRLSAEQLEFRDTVRDFVKNEVKPAALHPSRLEPFEKPLLGELLDYASRMGLRTLSLSEAAGGAGADTLTSCIVLEELAAGDVDIAMSIALTQGLARALFESGASDAQRSALLPAFMDDHRYHLALAANAAHADRGWHYHREYSDDAPPAATAARQANGDWLLNGSFAFVANAPIAKLLIVQAKDDAGGTCITVLVPAGTPGLEATDATAAFGGETAGGRTLARWHHGAGGAVRLTNCRVPAANVLSADGAAAFSDAAYAMRADAHVAAVNLGLGRAAYEAAVDYAKIRVQGGRPIVQHQSIGGILADIAIKLELARNAIWKAAWAADNPEAAAEGASVALPLHTIARTYTAEAMHEATLGAAECFGAMGVMRDMPLQKYVHDAFVFLNGCGHDSATKLEVAEALAGYEREYV
ncbi:MAG TPA: acyl-CoA dehydrogenase family protein [Burkholderiales bacterium]|nr:acyl-CoA dehydrogenase family protein [Burkholderiales bacterium]